jgi:hypothetical protein
MENAGQIIEGAVASRRTSNGWLVFVLQADGNNVTCYDATGAMSAMLVYPGRRVRCHGAWSGALEGIFEVQRIEPA